MRNDKKNNNLVGELSNENDLILDSNSNMTNENILNLNENDLAREFIIDSEVVSATNFNNANPQNTPCDGDIPENGNDQDDDIFFDSNFIESVNPGNVNNVEYLRTTHVTGNGGSYEVSF